MADRIVLNTISYHGHGAIENIVPELTARGYKKAFVCSDPDLIKFGVTKKVTDLLDAANFAYSVYSEIKPNPTIANVQDGVAAFKASSSTTPNLRMSALWRAWLPPRSTRYSPLQCPPLPVPLPRSPSTM